MANDKICYCGDCESDLAHAEISAATGLLFCPKCGGVNITWSDGTDWNKSYWRDPHSAANERRLRALTREQRGRF